MTLCGPAFSPHSRVGSPRPPSSRGSGPAASPRWTATHSGSRRPTSTAATGSLQHYTEPPSRARPATVLGGNPRVAFEIDREPDPRARAGARATPARPASRSGLSPATPSTPSWSATPTSSPRPPARRWPSFPRRPTTRSSSTAGVGLGKTHLLHAVGHQIARLFPSLRLLYLSSERFTNDADQRDPLRPHRGVPRQVPHDRPAPDRRHPVHLRQGADPGGVLPHLQRPLRGPEADRALLRLRRPRRSPRSRSACARASSGASSPTSSPPTSRRGSPSSRRRPRSSGSVSPTTSPTSSRAASRPTSARSRARSPA